MTLKNHVQLIVYPDSLGGDLVELHYVLRRYLSRAVGGVHLLPFYPLAIQAPDTRGNRKLMRTTLDHWLNVTFNSGVKVKAMPITGYMMTSYHGFPTYFFGLEFEPLVEKSDVYIIWGTFHKYLFPYVLYIVLGAHILGAMKHHFIDRHSAALNRMVG